MTQGHPTAGLLGPAVVLCPPLPPDTTIPSWFETVRRVLTAQGVPVLVPSHRLDADPQPASVPAAPADPTADRLALAGWVADQAVAITAARVDRPLILVAWGAAVGGLPALALSQRAARHSVVGYVMVDGDLPRPTNAIMDWPAAPVRYVRSAGSPEAGSTQARLRGWTVVDAEPGAAIVAYVRAWPDLP